MPRQESRLKQPKVGGWSKTGTEDVTGRSNGRGWDRETDAGSGKDIVSGLLRL